MFRNKILAPLIAICLIASPLTVHASQEDVAALINTIDEFTSLSENPLHAEEVRNAWKTYQNMPTAEKIYVTNSDKLKKEYITLVRAGVIIDEDMMLEEEQNSITSDRDKIPVSDTVESQKTDYTFRISETQPTTSIVIRFTTDADNDGCGDIPNRITLTSPSGVTTPVSVTNPSLVDSTMNISFTWTKNYVQMDISYATIGKWTIYTSTPVTFSKISYAGGQLDIIPEDDNSDIGNETNGQNNSGTKKEKSPVGGIILIAVMVLALIIWRRRMKKKSNQDSVKENPNDNLEYIDEILDEPRRLTDEEVVAQMKRDYFERLEIEKQMVEAEAQPRTKQNRDDDEEYIDLNEVVHSDEDLDETIQEYTEGDTGLLYQKKKISDSQTTNKRPTFNFDEDDDPLA